MIVIIPAHEPYNSVININAPGIPYPGLLSPWKLHLKLLPNALPLYHILKHDNIYAALRERARMFYPKQSNTRLHQRKYDKSRDDEINAYL